MIPTANTKEANSPAMGLSASAACADVAISLMPAWLRVAAVVIMIERGFRHLPIVGPGSKILGVFSVRDALPREIGNALSLAEFNEQVNDALG